MERRNGDDHGERRGVKIIGREEGSVEEKEVGLFS